jgi:hypothetical protein
MQLPAVPKWWWFVVKATIRSLPVINFFFALNFARFSESASFVGCISL